MKNLLYVKASPMEELSSSVAVADAFVEAYRKRNPEDKITVLDLFKTPLPPFDGFTVRAKYAIMRGKPHSREEAAGWQAVVDVINRFKAADKYVFAVPMWNFGIPYPLKHYIDVITQPGLTFSFSPSEGYKGLVTGRSAVVVYARGGVYSPGSGAEKYDFQMPYVQNALGFIGITDVKTFVVEPTLAGGPDTTAAKVREGIAQAVALAKSF